MIIIMRHVRMSPISNEDFIYIEERGEEFTHDSSVKCTSASHLESRIAERY